MAQISRYIAMLALAVSIIATGRALSATPAAKRPLKAEDSVMLKRPQDAQISPDGKWIAFYYNEPLHRTGERNSDIWLVPTAGGEPRKLTNGPKLDNRPRWSPDSRSIAFLSDRGEKGKTQLYVIRIDGGEAVELTNVGANVSAHAWSPDGKKIAFLMTDAPTSEEEQKQKEHDDAQIFDGNFKFSRLYTVDIETKKVTKVTTDQMNVWEYDWSPDGSRFVIAVSETPRIDESYVRARLETIPSEGGTSTKLLVPSGKFPGKIRQPIWSPDGQSIAYLASGGEGREPYAGRLWIVPAKGGQPQNLTEDFYGTFTGISWLAKRRQILVTAIEGVHNSVLVASPGNGETYTVIPSSAGAVIRGDVSVSANGEMLAMIKEDATHPSDIWVENLSSVETNHKSSLVQVTRLNPQAEEWEWGSSEPISWKAKDGLEIQGVLVKPINYEAGKRYPLLVHVHGGPESADLNGFHLTYSDWAFLMAARGYAVLLPNYRGSIGRGVKYTMGDLGDMGGKEFTDIMDGVDALIERGIVDGDRLGIGGWSYGGYMTAWAVTQTTRFKVGIMGAGISNWVSFMSQTDIPYENAEAHWGDTLFNNPKIYSERSPVEHITKAHTPVLILHGAVDPRVPLPQGQEFYSRLRFQGVPASLIIYPREQHGLTEPSHQLDAIQRMYEWVDKYMK